MKYVELNTTQQKMFQRSILKTVLTIESTFFQLAEHDTANVLVVCDRGAMDPSACEIIIDLCT